MLADVLEKNLTIVFCGTAVGDRSAQSGVYYAGPGNRFWRVLHEIGLTPRVFKPAEYSTLPQHGIGLSDLVKSKSGMDSKLSRDDFETLPFEQKILAHAPRIVAFNGKRAAQEFLHAKQVEYGKLDRRIGDTRLFALPSTSGAANSYWDVEYWDLVARVCAAV